MAITSNDRQYGRSNGFETDEVLNPNTSAPGSRSSRTGPADDIELMGTEWPEDERDN